MKRRRFLQVLLSLLGSTAILSLLYPLLKFLAPPSSADTTDKVILAKREIPDGDATEIVFRGIPAIVLNRTGKGLIALSRVCTHLGCLIRYDKESKQLVCPCHAGIFDLEGAVVAGPPPKPLRKLPLRVEHENIIIG